MKAWSTAQGTASGYSINTTPVPQSDTRAMVVLELGLGGQTVWSAQRHGRTGFRTVTEASVRGSRVALAACAFSRWLYIPALSSVVIGTSLLPLSPAPSTKADRRSAL
jgi:hypothetical protein